jgi:hypothetical protein
MQMQRTEAWELSRLGHVTASEFATAVGRKGKKLTQGAETYLYTLVGDHLARVPRAEVSAKPLEWGTNHEEQALGAYVFATGREVETQPFHRLDGETLIGASPDGFVEDGMVEVKCPYTSREHARNLITQAPPRDHYHQIQGNLWVTGRAWCDYVSYDPRVSSDHSLVVIRVDRDDEFINSMRDLIVEFRDILLKTLESINVEPFIFVE